jgi:hypothetical protein
MGIGKWFKEKWVDLSRPKPGGGFEPCGRSEAERKAYPKCVPAARAAKMSASEIQSAIRRKREAIKKIKSIKKPVFVKTMGRLAKAKR